MPAAKPFSDASGQSEWVMPDETGWRVVGHPAWLHALVGPQPTTYVIDPTRSGAVFPSGWATARASRLSTAKRSRPAIDRASAPRYTLVTLRP